MGKKSACSQVPQNRLSRARDRINKSQTHFASPANATERVYSSLNMIRGNDNITRNCIAWSRVGREIGPYLFFGIMFKDQFTCFVRFSSEDVDKIFDARDEVSKYADREM